ncbi:MetQ/NlpA family ABC transporter substrate-binding protein [Actinoplanes regularis]|uniref:D-methionine transport system substrate-binding protein n=1 Tax=Actinoplanes regularis TaxID=52697 RepID=A0A239BYV3_9ACTN|nr:MetQ/NlpA family ABC transporter substrate-binding protein [Actinoplanes regularis]GIE88226.1 hypothetical protein Are01nite_47060 [Actinoplanes regularis]SNS12598.1 D-methionine transport system substrate-binding protein [Actinoplanes regularis]
MKKVLAGLLALAVLAGCGSRPDVTYQRTDESTLLVYVGPGDYREALQYTVDHLLPKTARIQLADAPGDADRRIQAGDADLGFYQEGPAASPALSVVAKANLVPYGLYSLRWTDLKATSSWVNAGVVEDEVHGRSLPHGSKVVLPGATEGFARGLYLLQSAGLVKLDRPFGGATPADLTISEANVKESLRHLTLLGSYSDAHLREVYQQYDAIVLTPRQATTLGLHPASDALAVEPGPQSPWSSVLVAPPRLAGDPRVLELAHALESPDLAKHLNPASSTGTTSQGG